MPVLREKIQVGAIRPGGVVTISSAENEARRFGEMAQGFASYSGMLGKVAADMHEEEAIALAKQVAMSVDDNGVPQVDRSVGDRLSIVARRSFDRVLDERYEAQLQMETQARLLKARDENMMDPDGFAVDAGVVAEEMTRSVPEEFRGRWSDFLRAYSLRYGAELGRSKEQYRRKQLASGFSARTDMALESILTEATAGNHEEAIAEAGRLEREAADLVARKILLPHEAIAANRAAQVAFGEGLILQKINAVDTDEEKIAMLLFWEESLRDRSDDAVDIVPDDQARMQLAQSLGTRRRMLESGIRARMEAEERRVDVRRVALGGGSPTEKKDRGIADEALASHFNGYTPTWETWASTDMTTDVLISMSNMKVMPQSLVQAFNLWETMEPDGKLRLYNIWRSLQYGTAPDGTPLRTTGMLSAMPERVDDVLFVVDTMLKAGPLLNDDPNLSMEERNISAMQEISTRALAAFGEDNDTALFSLIDASISPSDAMVGGRGRASARVLFNKVENVKNDLNHWVYNKLTQDASRGYLWGLIGSGPDRQPDMRHAKKIGTMMRYFMLTDEIPDIDDAYEAAATYLEQRIPETTVMMNPSGGPMVRSEYDPGVVYPAPPDPRDEGVLFRTYTPEPYWEKIINKRILPLIDVSDIRDSEYLAERIERDGSEVLNAGEHYYLAKVPSSDPLRPTYHVYLRGDPHWIQVLEEGRPVVIDLQPAWKKMWDDHRAGEQERLKQEAIEYEEQQRARDREDAERRQRYNPPGDRTDELTPEQRKQVETARERWRREGEREPTP